MKIAVVGSGIGGNLAARMLSARHEVTLFEGASHAGGHAQTVHVDSSDGRHAVDVGFMVFNERTYPNFTRLLRLLGVASQPSDMSFSVRCEGTGLEYQGSSLAGLFAQRRNLLRPRFHRMLADIGRFNLQARRLLARGAIDPAETLDAFLDRHRFGRSFRDHYLVPMAAAIWSAPPAALGRFPLHFLLAFFENHGLLQLRDRPEWRTVAGGSRRYVEALLRPLADRVRLDCPIERIARRAGHVLVTPRGESPERFEQVVLATHPDQALRLLEDPSPAERDVLGAFRYQANDGVLHTDRRLLPRRRAAWASWNYHVARDAGRPVAVTYDLTRLQRVDAAEPICLTLNGPRTIDAARVVRRIRFRHPLFDRRALGGQARWEEINGRQRTWYCGAYWGHGFHEDGVNSALAVGRRFDLNLDTLDTLDTCDLDSCRAVSTRGSSGIAV